MSDKTEQPTPKKLRDAFKEGKAPRSAEFSGAIGVLVAVGVAYLLLSILSDSGLLWVRVSIESAIRTPDPAEAGGFAKLVILISLVTGFGLSLIAAIAAFVASAVQTKGVFSTKPLTPDLSRLNPVEGVKRLFSLRSVAKLGVAVIKLAIAALIANHVGEQIFASLGAYLYLTPKTALRALAEPIFHLLLGCGLATLAIGMVDLIVQRAMFIRDLRQDKEEVKRDYKEMEGEPRIKQQRRQIALDASFDPPGAAVKRSDVIVTNPTHLCVGIRYAPDGDAPVPILTLKAADAEVPAIKASALAQNVPVIEWVTLARRLYKDVRVNEPVPDDLFEWVAEVLAWVETRRADDSHPWIPPRSPEV